MRLRPSHSIVLLAALVALLLCALTAYDLRREYLTEIEAAGATTRNLARLLEEHARQSLEGVKIGVERAMEEIGSGGDSQTLHARLKSLLPQNGLIGAFGIIGPDGRPVLATLEGDPRGLPSLTDRDYFVAHRDAADRGLVIGAAARSRVDGTWMLPVSRRIEAPNGGFGGVLLASVDPARLRNFYGSVDVGPNGFVALFQREGWIVARAPHNEEILKRNWADSPMFREHLPAAPAKTVRQVVVADGVERIYSYRALRDFPAVVAVGLSLAEVLAPWRQRLWTSSAALLLVLAVLAAATLAIVAQLRRREAAETELRRLSTIVDLSSDLIATARADGQFVYLNPAARRAAGIGPEEDAGRYRTQQFYSAEQWAFVQQVARPAALKDGTWTGEMRLQAADGRYADVLQLLIAHRDAAGHTENFTGLSRDITERKRAERALQDQTEMFRVAEQMAHMISLEWDIQADRLTWSRSPAWLLGPRPPSGSYPLFKEMVHPEDRERFLAMREAALEDSQEHRLDYRIVRTDEEIRWISSRGRVIHDAGGRAERMHIALRDVTEQKQIELKLATLADDLEAEVASRTKALATSEARLRQLLSATPAVIWSSRAEGDYARDFVSENVREIFGYRPEDFTSEPRFWESRVHPEDRPGLFARLPGEIEANRLKYEYRFQHADGQWRWVRADATVIRDEAGRPEQIVGYWIDVTARKETEDALRESAARYQRAVNGTNDGIWEWIPSTGEDYLSPRWKQLLGFEDHELPNVQESFFDQVHPEDRPRVSEAARGHLEDRKPFDVELRLRCKSGEYRWFSSRGQAEWDQHGQPLHGGIHHRHHRAQACGGRGDGSPARKIRIHEQRHPRAEDAPQQRARLRRAAEG